MKTTELRRQSFRTASLLVVAALLASAGAAPQTSTAEVPKSLEGLAWIQGAWQGGMGKATMEEHWIAPAGNTMLGVNRTVSGGRTVAFEFLRLEAREDGIYYVAHPNGRPGTPFKLTRLEGEQAVFENPEHDNPKIIRYRRNADGTLTAEIEGDDKGKRVKQAFHLRPMAP